MSATIGIVIALINGAVFLLNRERGIALYVVLAMVSPVVYFGSLTVSYEILFFPLLLILYFFGKNRFVLRGESLAFFLYFTVYLTATLFSSVVHSCPVVYSMLFGTLRLIILFILFSNELSLRNAYTTIIKTIVCINAVVVLIQYINPGSASLFVDLYAKDSATALLVFEQTGVMSRLTGVFSNVVPAAFFNLVAFVVCVASFRRKPDVWSASCIVFSVLCGILTSSRAFWVGLPCLCLAYWVLIKIYRDKNTAKTGRKLSIGRFFGFAGIILVAALLVFWLFIANQGGQLEIWYRLNYFTNTSLLDFFNSRFSEDTGVTLDAFRVFLDNLVIGVGATTPNGEFLGDSQLIALLHNSGIVGTMLIFGILAHQLVFHVRRKSIVSILILLVIIVISMVATTVFSFFGIITLSYVSLNLSQRSESEKTSVKKRSPHKDEI